MPTANWAVSVMGVSLTLWFSSKEIAEKASEKL
jgi:hypothetical protein